MADNNVVFGKFGGEPNGPQAKRYVEGLIKGGSAEVGRSLGQLMLFAAGGKVDGDVEAESIIRSFGRLNQFAEKYSYAFAEERSIPENNVLNMAKLLLSGFTDIGNVQNGRDEVYEVGNQLAIDDIRGSFVFFQTINKRNVNTKKPFHIGDIGVVACYWSENPDGLRIVGNPLGSIGSRTIFDPAKLDQLVEIFSKEDEESSLINLHRSVHSPYGLVISYPITRIAPPTVSKVVQVQIWDLSSKQ